MWKSEMQRRVMDLANNGYYNELLYFGSDLYGRGKVVGAIGGLAVGAFAGFVIGIKVTADYYKNKKTEDENDK